MSKMELISISMYETKYPEINIVSQRMEATRHISYIAREIRTIGRLKYDIIDNPKNKFV